MGPVCPRCPGGLRQKRGLSTRVKSLFLGGVAIPHQGGAEAGPRPRAQRPKWRLQLLGRVLKALHSPPWGTLLTTPSQSQMRARAPVPPCSLCPVVCTHTPPSPSPLDQPPLTPPPRQNPHHSSELTPAWAVPPPTPGAEGGPEGLGLLLPHPPCPQQS